MRALTRVGESCGTSVGCSVPEQGGSCGIWLKDFHLPFLTIIISSHPGIFYFNSLLILRITSHHITVGESRHFISLHALSSVRIQIHTLFCAISAIFIDVRCMNPFPMRLCLWGLKWCKKIKILLNQIGNFRKIIRQCTY